MTKKLLLRGEVGYVDSDADILILKCSDMETGNIEVVNVSVPPKAEFQGAGSLYDFNVGDEVVADIYESDVSGILKAKAIALIRH